MTDTTFDELHPRASDGRFSTKDVDEAEGGLETLEACGNEPMTGEEMIEIAQRVVRSNRRRRSQGAWIRQDDDDVVQEAIALCLEAQARGKKVGYGYVAANVTGLISRDRDMASSDAKAIRLLSEATARLEQEQGSEATQNQIVALAKDIVDSWPEGTRRPSNVFYRRTRVVSLDEACGSNTTLVDVIEDRAAAFEDRITLSDNDLDDASVHELLDRHERAFGRSEHMAIKRAAWNALAEVTGAPKVRPHLSKNRVTAARTIMVRHPKGVEGAVKAALKSWDNLEDNEYTEALFTPFNTDDEDERQAVVDQLRMKPEHAADLWGAALAAANTSHEGKDLS